MIEEISIHDLGVIGQARLPLGPGFTALTGETGAGKTMVVTALGLLLGERADSGAVRAGSEQTSVEGRWLVPEGGAVAQRARDAGGELDPAPDGRAELVLGRTVTSEGRSRATVGGRSTPVGVLGELGERLVVVHGQSDQIRLRSETAQREALDRFAGPAFAARLADYREVFERWQAAQSELDVLTAERDRRAREAEELRAAMAEIEAVDPQPGEDTALTERTERLTNLEDLRLAATEAQEAVSSQLTDDARDVVGLLDTARRALDRVVAHDPEVGALIEAVDAASFAAAEVSARVSHYLGALDTDGGRELETLQERRAVLAQLVRRYGPTLDDVLEYARTGGLRLLELDGDDERITALAESVQRDREELGRRAEELTALRREAGERLSAAVTEELHALAMPDARLSVAVTPRDPGLTGADQVELLLEAHAGAEARPLARGASGGELSRVMLAIEVVLAGSDPVPTFVFDEVDAGVGGASALEIGRRLARLAESAQVIVVTHLAQVAAFAGNHLVVEKAGDGSITTSSVRLVHAADRAREMARLLSGSPDSESALAHAQELLEAAHGRWD
ncbi:MAG: DNA repair protein RecN [Actinomycetales bacterium]|nr:DNA repair protein RecN [Actinomycetales bacterium]